MPRRLALTTLSACCTPLATSLATSPVLPADQARLGCLLNLAACQLRLSQPIKAIAACDLATALDAQSAKAWFRRGQACLALGQVRAARTPTVTPLNTPRLSLAPSHTPSLTPTLALASTTPRARISRARVSLRRAPARFATSSTSASASRRPSSSEDEV